MANKSTLGQQFGPGSPAGVIGAGPMSQGGFMPLMPGQFPVGAVPTGTCPSGYLPAPSPIVPGGYTCIKAPGSYTVPMLRGK